MLKENLERALGFFEMLMKMLHPFMPFITEEIWQRIQDRSEDEALTISSWPEIDLSREEEKDIKSSKIYFEYFKKVISAIRNIRAEKNISPNKKLKVFLINDREEITSPLKAHKWIIEKLEAIESIQIGYQIPKPKNAATKIVSGIEIWVPLEGLIDLEKERKRIQKEIDRLEGFLKSVEKKLANEQFMENAPDAVVDKERQKKTDAKSNLEKLRKQLEEFED
ncbi:MAG: class I tRNA ligase family protein, partial [Bacteroidetes bacterium]|jgi:valyl-tRNA synthetase|nr:class I tRNA ligase family protein [Bacteroidota bacterium]